MGICRACGQAFWACPSCDRYGEVRYCGGPDGPCRLEGRRQVVAKARRAYRASPEGREQHCDEELARRLRRPGRRGRRGRRDRRGPAAPEERTDVQVVGDPPPSPVEVEASSCPRNAALASTLGDATAWAPRTTDDESTDGDVGSPAGAHTALDDGRPGRADAGGAGPGVGGAPSCGGDAARGLGALAPAGSIRCAVCGRWGQYVTTSPGRRVGFWRKERALRRGGGAAAARAPGAPPLDAG